jgi:predicted metal-binding protein
MNLNLVAYSVFIGMMVFIIVVVGKICYKNGNIFVAQLIPGHLELCQQINKILLIGYYLVNIGYCAVNLSFWQTITSLPILLEVISLKMAGIIIILSGLHYLNIFLLTTQIQKLIKPQ